jgi:chromosome segregation ATPase
MLKANSLKDSKNPDDQAKHAKLVEKKLTDQLEASQRRVREIESKFKEAERRLQRTEDLLKNEQAAGKTATQASGNSEAKLKSDLLAASRKNSELMQKMKEAEKRATQAEAAKKKAMEDVSRLANQNAANQKTSGGATQEETTKMRMDLAASERKNQALDTQMKRLEKQTRDAQGKLEAQILQTKAAQKEAAAMEARFKQDTLTARRQAQDYQNKLKDAEKRIKELSGAQSKGGAQEQVNITKFKQIEANNKKLMQELSKAKNMAAQSKSEMAKANAEKTGLQNKIKQMERELARSKQAIANLSKKTGRKAS